ncbi:MAG: tetratricopeptide repeat protein [Calditrichaeota bacterium]|nr:tetratricopeptide repeat protein [Calditrichota bacterium]
MSETGVGVVEALGLHGDVAFGDRSLHVQTVYHAEQEKIVSSVYDGGRLLERRERDVSPDFSVEEIRERLEDFHRRVTADYEILHYIQQKIRTVTHAPSNNRLGLVFLRRGLHREALREFTLAVKLDPEKPEYYGNLARALLALGRDDEALVAVREAIEKGPNYADLHNLLGLVLHKKKQFVEAIRAFQEALRLNPRYAEAYLNLARVLLASARESTAEAELPPVLTRVRKALSYVREAAQLSPVLKTEDVERVFEAARLQDLEKAERQIDALRAKLPTRDRFLYDHEFYLQFMYGGKGKDEQAVAAYVSWLQREIEKHPEFADLHNSLGVAYLIQARNLFLKALDEFREALRINPDFARAAKNLRLAQNDGKGFLILLRAVLK